MSFIEERFVIGKMTPSVFPRYLTVRLLLACMVCLVLTGCLPGENKEKKVINQTADAAQTVQVDKLAADMAGTARSLAAGGAEVKTAALKTIHCGTQIVSYIPNSAPLVKNGTLSDLTAQNMQTMLHAQFASGAAISEHKTQGDMPTACGAITDVAMNSPILVLTDSFAAATLTPGDQSTVRTALVAPCDTGGPGVMTKINNATDYDRSKCGGAVTARPLNLRLDVTATMPDWEGILAGNATATKDYICIKEKINNVWACPPTSATTVKQTMHCTDAQNNGNNLMVNPVFDTVSGLFKQGASGQANCGQGWIGDIVAKVDQQACTINNGHATVSTVYYIANVAAKCTKVDVRNIPTQCPGDPTKLFYAQYNKADMLSPVLLEPQQTQNNQATTSLIAEPGYDVTLQQSDPTMIPNIESTLHVSSVYNPTIDLRPLTNPDEFSAAMIKDMGPKAKLHSVNGCNTVGNMCGGAFGGAAPDHVVLVIDRSASMGSLDASGNLDPASALFLPANFNQNYTCKAGLKNIFTIADSTTACAAAKTFLANSQANKNLALSDFVQANWAGRAAPTGVAATAYQTMKNALIDKPKYTPYLQYALTTGWDCSGRANGNNGKDAFPMDMFGQCHGASSCDSCPGECDMQDPLPVDVMTKYSRIQVVEWMLRNLALAKFNPGTILTVSDFVDGLPHLTNFTFCPPARQNADGVCDLNAERAALIRTISRMGSTQYVKTINTTVVMPSP